MSVIKMAYTIEQSCVRLYQRKDVEFPMIFHCKEGPRESTIHRLVEKFEEASSMIDNKEYTGSTFRFL